jgi:hypothetical protein
LRSSAVIAKIRVPRFGANLELVMRVVEDLAIQLQREFKKRECFSQVFIRSEYLLFEL